MAFVSQGPRTFSFQQSSQSKLGPGEYNPDISAIGASVQLSKRLPGFATTEERPVLKQPSISKHSPGPGSYIAHGEIGQARYERDLDEKIQYVVKDNGHINLRTQTYAFGTKVRQPSQAKTDTPGPGQYNADAGVALSIIEKAKKSKIRRLTSNSSGNKSVLLNRSIPSIPFKPIKNSGELGSIAESNQQFLKQDSINQSFDGSTRFKTNDEMANLGPGAYFVQDSILRKSPKAMLDFSASKSLRKDFIRKTTLPQVGPGAYETTRHPDRSIPNPTFGRERVNKSVSRPPRTKKGSINANFDDNTSDIDDQDEEAIPGPGQYLNESHISTFLNQAKKPDRFQFFGSQVDRFHDPSRKSLSIGPGYYQVDSAGMRSTKNRTFNFLSPSFMGPSRDKYPLENKEKMELPGPGEYKSEEAHNYLKSKYKGGFKSSAFQSTFDRFKVPDPEVPGPGKYQLPGAVNLKGPTGGSKPLASYQSGVKRELTFFIDKDVPGIGKYDGHNNSAIGVQKIQGGAPNNFLLLQKSMLNRTQRAENPKSLNREILVETSTPQNIGPGYYESSYKFKFRDQLNNSESSGPKDNLTFGRDSRFRDPKMHSPGPGAYSDLNKWHKKTYNLKFLNVSQMYPVL